MTSVQAKYLLAGILTLGLASMGIWLWFARQQTIGPDVAAEMSDLSPSARFETQLLFPGPDNRLHPELRQLPVVADTEDAAKRVEGIVAAVLTGPENEELLPALPEGTKVARILLTHDGTAFIDLSSSEGSPPPAWGSTSELLAVYSLVNSVIVNEPSVRRVALLWNSQHRTTLAGHVDLTRPLSFHRGLMAPDAEIATIP